MRFKYLDDVEIHIDISRSLDKWGIVALKDDEFIARAEEMVKQIKRHIDNVVNAYVTKKYELDTYAADIVYHDNGIDPWAISEYAPKDLKEECKQLQSLSDEESEDEFWEHHDKEWWSQYPVIQEVIKAAELHYPVGVLRY